MINKREKNLRLLKKLFVSPFSVIFLVLILKGVYSEEMRLLLVGLAGWVGSLFIRFVAYKGRILADELPESSAKIDIFLRPYRVAYGNIENLIEDNQDLDIIRSMSEEVLISSKHIVIQAQQLLEKREDIRRAKTLSAEVAEKVDLIDEKLTHAKNALSNLETRLEIITLEKKANDLDHRDFQDSLIEMKALDKTLTEFEQTFE